MQTLFAIIRRSDESCKTCSFSRPKYSTHTYIQCHFTCAGCFLKNSPPLSLSFLPQTKNTSCKTHCFLPCQVCSGRRWRQQTARPPVLWVRPPSQWLAACKTNLKADEWHLGARKHAGRPKIFAEAHTVRRMKAHYVNTWAPSSWGIFKMAPAPCIKPAKKQRHSFKSRMQQPQHNLAPEGRVRKGP